MLLAKKQSFFSFSFLSLFVISLIIVAFGQPAWLPFLGLLAGTFGYALFWKSMLCFQSKKARFFLSILWFSVVQAVQLSWMTATVYQGDYIFLIYFFLLIWLSLQFAILSLLIPAVEKWTWLRVLFIASVWTIMEWSRLFVLMGFAFNPIGIALTGSIYSLQTVSLVGVYGLSFWIIFVNLIALRVFYNPVSVKKLAVWGAVALFPFIFGIAHVTYHNWSMSHMKKTKNVSALMVQTALSPGEKWGLKGFDNMIYPLHQWQRILWLLKDHRHDDVDLIVFPESAVPFSAYTPAYTLEMVKHSFKHVWGIEDFDFFPKLKGPLATQEQCGAKDEWLVSNAFWAQTIANAFDAQVIIGLEDEEKGVMSGLSNYTSAFNFKPFKEIPKRYDKRVLLPIVEYLPFEWCKEIAERYGISGWYEEGTEAIIFQGETLIGASVCMEEMFGHLIRDNRLLGAELLVNVTNDVWFPCSRLPEQHFYHGLIRSVENGVPLVRACNTGVTAAVDSLGRVIATFSGNIRESEWQAGVLAASVPIYIYDTLYTRLGDVLIIGVSFLIILLFVILKICKKS